MRINRGRLTVAPLDATPAMALARSALPHHMRDWPLAEIERGDDRGWLIRTRAGLWALLTPGGSLQTLPQHKIGPALAAAGIEA